MESSCEGMLVSAVWGLEKGFFLLSVLDLVLEMCLLSLADFVENLLEVALDLAFCLLVHSNLTMLHQ